MAELSLQGITKEYPGGVRAVRDLDLTVRDGEFFALLGPSGCGKTTLLRTIAGLEEATSGTLRIGDIDVTALAPGDRDVAMVFQDYALFPHMTVRDNIAYPLRIRRVRRSERALQATKACESLSLAELVERRPAELSGGQQQRVALARAIVSQPSVFLFDEPLSNLDARLRLEARSFLKRLQRELGTTTVFVTHDQSEALAMADRIAVMELGEIRQVGTPREVFRRPASTFVASFIGSTPMNLLDGVAADGGVQIGEDVIPLPADVAAAVGPGEPVVVGIRPEYLTLHASPREGALSGSVTIAEHLGTGELLTLEAAKHTFGVVVPEDVEFDVGQQGWAVPTPGRLLVYRAADGSLIRTEEQP
jgi:multiple sugar transport system ATP-binding protein